MNIHQNKINVGYFSIYHKIDVITLFVRKRLIDNNYK